MHLKYKVHMECPQVIARYKHIQNLGSAARERTEFYHTKYFDLYRTNLARGQWYIVYFSPEAFQEIPKIKNLRSITFDARDLALCTIDLPPSGWPGEDFPQAHINYHTDLSLLEYTKRCTPRGWSAFFSDPTIGLKKISDELSGQVFYPSIYSIYTSFDLTIPDDIKVLIIGQDPYFNGQAMGISFSVRTGVALPPSLKNIFKELESDGFSVSNKTNGNLVKWCRQGVFMLNTALTVAPGKAGSHTKLWLKEFTPKLMEYLNKKGPVVVIMWGNDAQSFADYFDDRHKKIRSSHPSPFSAAYSFFGSKPFSKTNKYLKEMGKKPIDWSL
jgi:uracil-DNA glycosylase